MAHRLVIKEETIAINSDGFPTRYTDCRVVSMLYLFCFITFDYIFILITKIRLSNNYFEFIN